MSYKKTNNLPLVVIFGRTNVGKSTLFNCLTEKHQALVSDIEGTTRDSNIGEVEWLGKKIKLIDTGGIINLNCLFKSKEGASDIETKVQRQAASYLKKADIVLFLVDRRSGVLPQDKQMSLFLKKTLPLKNKVVLVINKADNPKDKKQISEFHQLNLGEPIAISAANGSGTGDLLDIIIEKLNLPQLKDEISLPAEQVGQIEDSKPISVCIIGQPNVGKSSLLNSILGEERVIVSPIPHTTREPQDTFLEYNDKIIKLIDTAGISKKGQQSEYKKNKIVLEKMGIAKSLVSLRKADIALFVIDISIPITHQDTKIIDEIISRQKSLILIANKWDLVNERDTKKFTNYIYAKLPFIQWVPIQFVSALTGEKVKKVLDNILKIDTKRKLKIEDDELKSFLKTVTKMHLPTKGKGTKNPRIRKMIQIGINPPEFSLTIGSKEDLHSSYVRFIENQLRKKFDLLGTPVRVNVEKAKSTHGSHNK